MTSVAFQFGVAVFQWKLGVLAVIEARFFPGFRVMTMFAFFSQLPSMRIVERVTTDTGLERFFVSLIWMTAVAFDLPMFAFQGKLGFPVMVEYSLAPGGFFVAVLTFLSQSFKMRVVGLVTGIAIHRRFPVFFFGVMAVVTFDRGVRSFQRKVRESVIKRVFIQMNNVRVPSFMIGVAELAFFFGDIFFQTVKSLFTNDVFVHCLVAIPAQFILRFLVKQGMAFGALRLYLGVALNNGAGHHKVLQRPCMCLWQSKHQ